MHHEQSTEEKHVHQRNGGLKSSHIIQVSFQKPHLFNEQILSLHSSSFSLLYPSAK